jgi:hypothetical protein
MPEKSPHESRYLVLGNAQHNEAIISMAEARQIESRIAGKERYSSLLEEKDNYFIVFESLAAYVNSDLSDRYSRRLKQQTLPFENILIQNDQPRMRSGTHSAPVYCVE